MDFFHILRTIIRKMSGTPFKGPPERKNFKKKKNVTKIAYMGRMTGIVKFVNGRFSLFYTVSGHNCRTLPT